MERILELLQKSGKQMSENYRGQREIMDKQVAMHHQMLGAMTEMWVEWMEKGKGTYQVYLGIILQGELFLTLQVRRLVINPRQCSFFFCLNVH